MIELCRVGSRKVHFASESWAECCGWLRDVGFGRYEVHGRGDLSFIVHGSAEPYVTPLPHLTRVVVAKGEYGAADKTVVFYGLKLDVPPADHARRSQIQSREALRKFSNRSF